MYNDNQIVLVPINEAGNNSPVTSDQSGSAATPTAPDHSSSAATPSAPDQSSSSAASSAPEINNSNENADALPETADVRIVSPSASISADYVPQGLRVPDVPMYQTQQLRSDAADALEEMFSAAKADGYDLYLISGYRSYADQQGLWDYYENYYGLEYTSHLDAHPGGSEHQLGLAADIGTTDNVCRLDTCFGDTGAFAWLQENSWKYGYIERYPQGKEDVTGIMYSPWGFRYTGTSEAEKIHASGMTMEEYYKTH